MSNDKSAQEPQAASCSLKRPLSDDDSSQRMAGKQRREGPSVGGPQTMTARGTTSRADDTTIELAEKDCQPSTSRDLRRGDSGQTDDDTISFDGSQDLFADGEGSDEGNADKPSIPSYPSLGPSLQVLRSAAHADNPLPVLQPSANLTVLFKCGRSSNTDLGECPSPFPARYRDRWDDDHVRMPCSSQNLYPIGTLPNKEPHLCRRWDLVTESLTKDIKSSVELESAIMKYNGRYARRWKFTGLHQYFNEMITAAEAEVFFNETLPKMQKLALAMPDLCTQPIPLLKQGMNHTLVLSQEQIACILANAFFCTFPRRNATSRTNRASEYSSYPEINFSRLFASKGNVQKLACLFHYFHRVTEKMPTGAISFGRRRLDQFPDWKKSTKFLSQLHISRRGTIEDFGDGMLQVDFANKFVGGGVLGQGCVQEEIRFVICPEMIASMLMTEVLADNECLIMKGCERFSYYSGYNGSFTWLSSYVDETPRDEWGRMECEVVAIDAKPYGSPLSQFKIAEVNRELNKAYCGFYRDSKNKLAPVATGNWGCGVFGGNKELKSLIQLLAATEAGRDVAYFTFDDVQLMQSLYDMHNLLTKEKQTVGQVYYMIDTYYTDVIRPAVSAKNNPSRTLFEYIFELLHIFDDMISSERDELQSVKKTGTSSNLELRKNDDLRSSDKSPGTSKKATGLERWLSKDH